MSNARLFHVVLANMPVCDKLDKRGGGVAFTFKIDRPF
jgi:hypothetical protein